MNDRLYVPRDDYVDLEVFIGPRVAAEDDPFEGLEQPIFVNYERVGILSDMGWPGQIEEFERDVERIRTKKTPEGEEGPALSKKFFQDFGIKLFRILFTYGDLKTVYRDRLRRARERDGVLRFNLCFDPRDLPPHLALAPWEYIFDPEEEMFLAASDGIAFSRRVPTSVYAEPFTVQGPLRLLVVISNPSDIEDLNPGLRPLDVDEERKAIEAALKDCEHIEVEWVADPPSHDRLRESLREIRPNIFHFIGHGVWRDGHPNLIIATDDNKAHYMDEDMLRDLLRRQVELKVVFLAACQSGEIQIEPEAPGEDEPWFQVGVAKSLVGIAPKLLKMGIPAVLAMQHPVSMPAARRFAAHFYEALSNEDPIDAAVNLAREDLRFEAENLRDFGTPVLYTLIPQLFKIEISAAV